MSRGSASWLLPYPGRIAWYEDWKPRDDKSPWRKFINLCKQLKRTRCDYSVTYIDMGEHCRAIVEWKSEATRG